jgi:hypothetical protein
MQARIAGSSNAASLVTVAPKLTDQKGIPVRTGVPGMYGVKGSILADFGSVVRVFSSG